MFKKLFLAVSCLLLSAAGTFAQTFPGASGNPSVLSRPGGSFYAPGFFWNARVISGNGCATNTGTNTCTGGATSGTIIIAGNASGGAGGLTLPDGSLIPFQTVFSTLTPIVVDFGQGAQETVTPTSVSVSTCPAGNLGVGGSMQCANFTGSFVNSHGQSAVVVDGTFGAQTAANYANSLGGGVVMVDPAWSQMGGTTALLTALVPFSNVSIQDMRNSIPQYWDVTPTSASNAFIATPTALTAQAACDATHTFCSDASVAGTWTSGTLFGCVAYVDIAGNEGACSTTASFTTVVSKAIDVGAPAASTGAVGYTIYLSLIGGSYAFAYQVPITAAVCTPTKLETLTPACALSNTTYGQTSSSAVIAAVTVNTSPLALQLGSASTTTDYVGNSAARTVYSYVPGSSGPSGLQQSFLAFTAGPATVATTVPQVIGTVGVPAGFMNQIGKKIRICGKEQMTNASATIEQIQLWWDGAGSNAAGVPVNVANLQLSGTGTAVAYNGSFCATLQTTVSGAGVTAGSIRGGENFFTLSIASAPTTSFSPGQDTFTATTASLNLAGGAGFTSRIHVVQLHTTGTDVSPQLASLTAEVLN
jgi:hypothetical protein